MKPIIIACRTIPAVLFSFSLFSFVGCTRTTPAPITETTMIESGPSTIQLKVRDKKLAAVQQALNEDGANLTVDGVMGAKTKQAIRAFQRKSGLMITGYPNKATLKKLNIQDTPTKK